MAVAITITRDLNNSIRLQVEYIRCLFNVGAGASLDEILSLVNNSDLKKVTLLYRHEADMLREEELKKVRRIANDADTELEVLWREYCMVADYFRLVIMFIIYK